MASSCACRSSSIIFLRFSLSMLRAWLGVGLGSGLGRGLELGLGLGFELGLGFGLHAARRGEGLKLLTLLSHLLGLLAAP
eukprot:scaffold73978_cov36-Phaeocystis_antarctica.AAC.1